VEDRPDEQVGSDLAPALIMVGGVGQVDYELRRADRARGEARAREVLEELAEELGIPDLDSDGPQFVPSIGPDRCVRKPFTGAFLLATTGSVASGPRSRSLQQPQDKQDDARPEEPTGESREREGAEEAGERGRVLAWTTRLRLPLGILARPRIVLGPGRRRPRTRLSREEPARTGQFALHAVSAAAGPSSRGQGVRQRTVVLSPAFASTARRFAARAAGDMRRMGRLRLIILLWLARKAWSVWQRRRRARAARPPA
jgi:hypothetical protein